MSQSYRKTSIAISVLLLAPLLGAMIPTAAAAEASGAFGNGVPTFAMYPSPTATLGEDSGEPTIGINWETGAVLMTVNNKVPLNLPPSMKIASINFDDSTVPATATWIDATNASPGSHGNIDPILFTDPRTGRTWAGGLDGACSVLGMTDDDGKTWLPVGNSCVATLDHETIGAGPFHTPIPEEGVGTYPGAVYYCAQASAVTCVASYDGGLTFPVVSDVACTFINPGFHGSVHVSDDGTVYLPFGQNSGSPVCIAKSVNNGVSWTQHPIPGTANPAGGFDPDVATTPSNWLYVGYADADGSAHVAVSKDAGATYTKSPALGANLGIRTTTFHEMVAGDDNRAALAFLGTSATGPAQAFSAASFPGVWYLYVSYTYDGGQTWTTVKASEEPVQKGCIWDGGGTNACRNMLDFMDAQVDAKGRVLVGFADGCRTMACNDRVAWATIARQSTGKGLFAAYDGATVTASPIAAAPGALASLSATLHGAAPFDVTVSWGDGDSDVYANVPAGAFTATHTYAASGTYPVTISVVDDGGATASASTTAAITGGGSGGSGTVEITSPEEGDTVGDSVHVTGSIVFGPGNHAPVAAFTASVSGSTVNVDATGSSDVDGDALTYAWSFGDSGVGAGATTAHTYANPGAYSVCLTVSDSQLTDEACQSVTIEASGTTTIANDAPGDAKGPTGANVASLDILSVTATQNANGEPVFQMKIANLDAAPPLTEGADGANWRVEWSHNGKVDFVQLAASLTTSTCGYGDTDTGGIYSQRGSAPCTVVEGANGLITITYPAVALSARGYTAADTFAAVKGTTGVYRGIPTESPVSAGGTSTYDTTDTSDFTLTNANVRFDKIGARLHAAPLAAPTQPPANPQDPDGQTNAPYESIPTMNVESAWFDSDANYLYIGLKVESIPADETAAAYQSYLVNFMPEWEAADPTWYGTVSAGNELTGLTAFAAYQPARVNGSTLMPEAPATTTFELQATSTDGTQNFFSVIGEIPGEIDPEHGIVWWQIPRTTLQNPPGGSILSGTSGATGVIFAGLLSTSGGTTIDAIGDSTGTGADYAFPLIRVDPPAVSLVPDHASGIVPLSVTFSASATTEDSIASWSLDLGDGATDGGAGAPPAAFSHVYTATGVYTATLDVLDTQGNAGSAEATIVVTDGTSSGTQVLLRVDDGDAVPATCDETCATWSADLDLSGEEPGELTITAELFVDGVLQNADEVTVTLERTGTAGLVIDSPTEGATFAPGEVNVTGRLARGADAPPQATLSADVVQGVAPLEVTFTIAGVDDRGITSWSLDTRDGAVPTGTSVPATVTHTYPAGDFQPILTVRDASGHTATDSMLIHVSAQNVAPTAPHSPNPANGATGRPTTLTLSWAAEDGNGDSLTYDVVVDGNLVQTDTPLTSYLVSDLAPSTTHTWQVTAKDGTTQTTGPEWTFTTAAATLTEAQKPHVIVGTTDSGINPYNKQFHRAQMTVEPWTYVTGMPSNIKQINLCFFDNATKTLDYTRCPASATAAPDADAAEWAKIRTTPTSQTGAGQGNVYWFAGTNIFLMSFSHTGDQGFIGLDGAKGGGDSHGTATSSNIVGSTTGTCPECYVVMVEAQLSVEVGPAYMWLSNQPYIDVVSSAVSCGLGGQNPGGLNTPVCGQPSSAGTKNGVSKGKIYFESSGNGVTVPAVGGLGVAPTTTAWLDNFNPWTIAVGCNAPNSGNMCLYSDFPNAIEGTGVQRISASVDSYTGTSAWAGTSFSAPSSAGVMARAIYALRVNYGDTQEGPSTTPDRSLVRIPTGMSAPASGPFANGKLTRAELEEILFKTARRDFTPLEASSLGGTAGQSAYIAGTPVSFVKEGYGEVYHGAWGVNGPGALPNWGTSGEIVAVALGQKQLPNRWVEEMYWEQVVEPAQEAMYDDLEIPDSDGLADGFPRDDAMDPDNLGGYRPAAIVAPPRLEVPANANAIPDGVQPSSDAKRLYLHAANLGPDPANPASTLFDYYMNTVEKPAAEDCAGAGCADSNAGTTGVGGGGFRRTHVVDHPTLATAVALDTTKDIVVHVLTTGFVGGPSTATSMTATLTTSDGTLVGTGTASAQPSLDGSLFVMTFKPLVPFLAGETKLDLATTDPAYSIFVNGHGASYVDLPVVANVGPVTPATPIKYYVDDFATDFTANGNPMEITRNAAKIAGDADRNGVVFTFPQAFGVNMPLTSDDVLASEPAILAAEGSATVYVCSPVVVDAGLAQATVSVTLSSNGVVLGSGSHTKLLAGLHSGDTTPFVVPLQMHPVLVPVGSALEGTINVAGPGGVMAENMALCGGGADHPWTIEIAASPLAVPTATLGDVPSTLSGTVEISGAFDAPARPDVAQVVWYAQDLGDWDSTSQTFTLETGAPGTSSPGPILPPSPNGYTLELVSARPLAEDAPRLSANGLGVAQFWVDSVGPSPRVTIDMSVLLENAAGQQRLLGQGSVTKDALGDPLNDPATSVFPQVPYTIEFTPLVTQPAADEKLVLLVNVHNVGPAATTTVTCFCGGPDEPVLVSLPKAVDPAPTAQGVDIDLGSLHLTVPAADGEWSATIDSRNVANGAQTLTVTPHATYAGVVIEGLPTTQSVIVQNTLNLPPTASLALSALSGPAPLDVTATLAGSDPDGAAALLAWTLSWGDGSPDATGIGLPATASHTYESTGNFAAVLTVRDVGGLLASAQQSVTAFEAPPVDEVRVVLDGTTTLVATDASGDGSFADWYALLDVQTVGLHTIVAQHVQGDDVVDSVETTFSIVQDLRISIDSPAPDAVVDAGAQLTGTTLSNDPVTSVVASLDAGFASSVPAASEDGFATWTVELDALGLAEDAATQLYVRATTASETMTATRTLTLNAAPNADIGTLTTLPAPTQTDIEFQGSFTPAASGANVQTWAWDLGDGATSSEVEPVHAYEESGDYVVTLTVTDTNGKSGTATFPVLILDQAPVVTIEVSPVSPTTLEVATITALATDADGAIVGPITLAIHEGIDASGPAIATGESPLDYQFPDNGEYTIVATATDDEGVQGTGQKQVSVQNVRPVASLLASAELIGLDQPVTLDASGSSDPDGVIDQYRFDFGDGQVVTTASAVVEHTYAAAGTYPVTVTVTDDDGAAILSDAVTVIVNATPELAFIGNQWIGEAQTLTLQLSATDPEGDALTFSADALPGSSTLTPDGLFTWTPGFGEEGNYPVTFAVSDGLSSDSEAIVISVGDVNRPPELAPVEEILAGAENAPFVYAIVASDPDPEDTLTYTVTGLPEDAAIDEELGIITWTPSYTQAGAYPVTLTVTDGDDSDTVDTLVVIANVDRTPTLAPVASGIVTQLDALRIPLVASDPDNDAITWTVTGADGADVDTSNGAPALVWTPTIEQRGEYELTVTARSGPEQLTATQTTTITVLFKTVFTVTHEVPSSVSGSPGQELVVAARVTNTGVQADSFTIGFSTLSPLWTHGDVPEKVSLAPGESAIVSITVTVPTNQALTFATVEARSENNTDIVRSARFRLDVPVVVTMTGLESVAGAAAIPAGVVHVTHLDGTAAVGALVTVTQTAEGSPIPLTSSLSGVTDANGDFTFDFTTDPRALFPGEHSLLVIAKKNGGRETTVLTTYVIGSVPEVPEDPEVPEVPEL